MKNFVLAVAAFVGTLCSFLCGLTGMLNWGMAESFALVFAAMGAGVAPLALALTMVAPAGSSERPSRVLGFLILFHFMVVILATAGIGVPLGDVARRARGLVGFELSLGADEGEAKPVQLRLGERLYENKDHGYRFVLPGRWVIRSTGRQVAATPLGEVNTTIKINLRRVTGEVTRGQAVAMFEQLQRKLKRTVPTVSIVQLPQQVRLGRASGFSFSLELRRKANDTVHRRWIVVSRRGAWRKVIRVVVVGVFPGSAWFRHQQAFERLVETFAFTGS